MDSVLRSGGGWLMSEEEFMKDIKWLDMLKIKASYGTLGNQKFVYVNT